MIEILKRKIELRKTRILETDSYTDDHEKLI